MAGEPDGRARCERHGLVPGLSFDLQTGYDLSRYSVQREVEKKIDEVDPDLLIGSPPCTKFSILQKSVRAKGLTDQQQEKFEVGLGQATRHINFCVRMYHKRRIKNRYYLHEHPLTATSWQLPSMRTIVEHHGNHEAVADQCAYGLKTKDPVYGILPARKPTRFATYSPAIAMV